MSASQNAPDGHGQPYQETEPNQVSRSELSELERVLEETLARHESDPGLTADEKESLLRVARRHQNSAVELEAVVPELVASLLHVRLHPLQLSAETWLEMCSQVAESLLDAPHARLRLERLWFHLCESV
jgi:hypothetical protein